MKKFIWPFALLLMFSACTDRGFDRVGTSGYVPVYAQAAEAKTTSVGPARATTSPGKIYAYRDLLFQVEQGKGIHIIDNVNPAQAKKIAFLSVPTCSELAVKQGFLYTNNLEDLLVFDLSNPTAPSLVKRIANAFPTVNQTYPPVSNVYFECPDASKGIVIDWIPGIINNPTCRR